MLSGSFPNGANNQEAEMAKVAFVPAEDFEDSEVAEPYQRVTSAGHEAVVMGKEKGPPDELAVVRPSLSGLT
ncbi:MAG: hypothetical protein ACRD0U_18660, partial [Acidimicrobiales bacterium]